MRLRVLTLHPLAAQDLVDWILAERKHGVARATALLARVEAFVRTLQEFPKVGTRYDFVMRGLRACDVPGLQTISVVFRLSSQRVTILRIGQLDRNPLSVRKSPRPHTKHTKNPSAE